MASEYGSAVVDHVIRYVSASAIGAFDPSQEGGCNKRYWFEKIDGRKTPETKAQNVGKEMHRQIEHYLTTGEPVFGPIVQPGLKFIPRPGKDLLVERGFGDVKAALATRELMMAGKATKEDVDRCGPAVHGIPVMGAMDLRHRRGEWNDNNGVLHREADPLTGEVVDWKSSSDIESYGKKDHELVETVQMPLYAKATILEWPDLNFVRVSHGQFGTRMREARKVSALLSRETIERRFTEIESTVSSMIDVAKETSVEKVEANLDSCNAFRGCPHARYCPRPDRGIVDLFQIKTKNKGDQMSGLFGQLQNPGATNGVSTATTAPTAETQGLFSAAAAAASAAPPPPPVPVMTDAEREAAVAAARARFQAEDGVPAVQPSLCSTCGVALHSENVSRLPNGIVVHIGCSGAVVATTPPSIPAAPIPAAPRPIGAVNPPDMPAPDPIAAASPLTPEAIATITDPQLRKIAEDHAAAHAAQAAAQAAANPKPAKEKTSGRCPSADSIQMVTPKEATTRKTVCKVCGKAIKIMVKDFLPDFTGIKIVGHNMEKPATLPIAAVPPISAAAIPTAAVLPLPVAVVPPIAAVPPIPVVAVVPPPPPLPVSAVAMVPQLADTIIPPAPIPSLPPVEVTFVPSTPPPTITEIAPVSELLPKSAAEMAKVYFEQMDKAADSNVYAAASIAASLIAITERLDLLLARK